MPHTLPTRFDYEDYRLLPDDGRRYEVLGGELHMTPAPSPQHQHASKRLLPVLVQYFEDARRAHVFYSPLDVILAPDDVVQPDLVVVREARQISSRGIEGPPLVVVEITSPGRLLYDRTVKAKRYAARAVPHYWILDPDERRFECFRLEDDRYVLRASGTESEHLKVPDFPGLEIPLATLWY